MDDQVVLEGKWEFNQEVTDVFENMLERSIPQYLVMRKACFDIATAYRQHSTDIVDLGCSRGDALKPFVDKYGAQNHYHGIEISKPMLEIFKNRFKGYIDTGIIIIHDQDLRKDYPYVNASITLCILTLQFTPIEYRLNILKNIFESTIPGGCLILVEKVIGSSAKLDAEFVRHYYSMKEANGYTTDQIERKRLSLEGVLVPVTARWNEELLNITGFSQIDCFWRWMNFAGWVAVK